MRWFKTVSLFKGACLSCGAVVSPGDVIAYRKRNNSVKCSWCIQEEGLELTESRRWREQFGDGSADA